MDKKFFLRFINGHRFSFQTKQFESSGPNLHKKGILGTKFKKIIVEFKISSVKYPFVSSFILKKTFSSFGSKFTPKKVIWGQNLGKWKVLVFYFGLL